MPEQVGVNREVGIIEVRSYDIVDFSQMAGSIETVKRLFEETGINRVLVDTRGLKELPGTVDMFELTKSFPKYLTIAVLFNAVEWLRS